MLGRGHLGQERAQPLGRGAGELSGDKRQRGHSGCPAWACDPGLWVPPAVRPAAPGRHCHRAVLPAHPGTKCLFLVREG